MRLQPRLLAIFLFVVVSCCPVVTGQQSSTLTLRRGFVASRPGAPEVQVTVDRRRVPLGTIVTFTLTPASVVRSPLYLVTLNFGDGKRQTVRATQISHLYQAVGTYVYSVQVKSNHQPPQVSLSATPAQVSPRQQVSFSAQTSGAYPNLRYRFSFGDGSTSGWQESPNANHAYQSDGKYSAFVDIGDGTKQFGGSTRKEIQVIAGIQPFNVTLTANPPTARARRPVTFVARAFPVTDNTKYRFLFGDAQSTAWQTSPQADHVYQNSGTYRAKVEATQFLGGRTANATSAPTVIAVNTATTTPTPGPTPRASPQPTPRSSPSPGGSPSPDTNSSPSPSPISSSSPVSSTSPSPAATGSPGQTGTNQNSGGSSSSPRTDASPVSGSSSNDVLSWFGSSGDWWKYLLILALILILIYQLTGLLFVARPTFTPVADAGVSTIANKERGLAIDFQMVLSPNVSTGAYAVETSESSLIKNADRLEERQILEI